jgi:transposase
MEKLFVGIDISKEKIDVSFCLHPSMEITESFNLTNSHTGINELVKKLKKQMRKYDLWVCFEHTGHYGFLLAHKLNLDSIPFSAVPAIEIKQSIGIVRGKNDQIDAARIAKYAATHHFKLKQTELPSNNLLKIRQLITYRDQLVQTSTQFKNSLKSYQISNSVIDNSLIITDIELKIESLKNDIQRLESSIEEIINGEPELKTNFNKITKIKGIGLLIASNMIIYTNNFKDIVNPRKFNCYAGLAPFEHKSGSSIFGKTKTSQLRNKTLKRLLFSGATSAARNDGQLRQYYQRKKAEGKHHMSVLNAIACKLVYRVFAVVKRDTEFVNFAQ